MQIGEFKWFLTSDGFRQLLALLGRNQQGIGTSSLATWVKNCEALSASQQVAAASSDVSQFIDAIYTKIDDGKKSRNHFRENISFDDLVSGEFIDCEGSGLFKLQSCCKSHSNCRTNHFLERIN